MRTSATGMTQLLEKQRAGRDIGFGALAVIVVAAASVAGQLATYPNLEPWYAGLAKPSFNPPNWIFAPVWTTLFVLMAFSVWRILRLPQTSARRTALLLFFIQLALNAAWSWMFFAAHSPATRYSQYRPAMAGYHCDNRSVLSAR